MENSSQPPAPASPAKVTPPANEPAKATQVSSNHEVVPMAARTAATHGSAAQPQRGNAIAAVPLASVPQPHPRPPMRLRPLLPKGVVQGSCSNKTVVARARTGTGAIHGTTAGRGAAMPIPRAPTAVGLIKPVQQTNPVVFGQGSSSSNKTVVARARSGTGAMHGTTAGRGAMPMPRAPTAVGLIRPVQQTNPVVFGQGSSSSNQVIQGSSSIQAVATRALAAPTCGPTAPPCGPVPRSLAPGMVPPTKLMTIRPSAPHPPKLPIYRPPPPPRPEAELASSSAAAIALLQLSSDLGPCVLNMQAEPPSPDQLIDDSEDQVIVAEDGSGSGGGGRSGDDMMMLDLNFPPVSNRKN